MDSFFNNLFDYNYYSNKSVIDQAKSFDVYPEKTMKLFSHVLNAHHIWVSRILEQAPKYEAWDEHPVSSWEDLHYENQRATFGILTNNENLERIISYQDSKGKHFSNTIKDILFHIINHSTYHRAQITQLLKDIETPPLVSDYIFYKRQ